jgi:glucose-6-phosphate dehydrogenase assembly protein OpcA
VAAPVALAPQALAASWEGSGATVAEIAGRLRTLRSEAAAGLPHGRSSLLNLVVWAPAADDVAAAFDLLDILVGPSRIIVLSPAEAGDSIGARLQVRAHQSPIALTSVCEEMVWLTLPGSTTDHAASVVTPLVRGDLPTFVWWPGPPQPALPTFRELARAADRLVTESDRSRDGASMAAALNAEIGREETALTDLAWGALTPWRQLIAQVMRPAQVAAFRAGPSQATLTHTGPEPTLGTVLLAGWLRDAVSASLDVSFQAVPGPAPMLAGIDLTAPSGHRLSAHRPSDAPSCQIEVEIPGSPARARTLPLRLQSRLELIAGEFEIAGRDRSFERALAAATF